MFRVLTTFPKLLQQDTSKTLLQSRTGLISILQINARCNSISTTTPFPEFENDGLKTHDDLYKLSINDPDHFWGTLARSRLQWFQDFNLVKDCDLRKGHIRWFQDGKINASGKQMKWVESLCHIYIHHLPSMYHPPFIIYARLCLFMP